MDAHLKKLLLAVLFLAGLGRLQAQDANDRYIQPPSIIQEYINKDKNLATLDQMSPDGDHFLVTSTTELSSLQLMSQKIYRLASLKITPATNRELDHSTYGIYAMKIYSLKARTTRNVVLPPGTFVSDAVWSPDGSRLAFLAHLNKGSQVWIADAQTGEAKALSDAMAMATLAKKPEGGRGANVPSRMLQWLPDGSIITLLVPPGRGAEPVLNPIPSSPLIRRTPDKPTPTATQPFLLESRYDQDLFRYYTTAQAAILAPGKAPQMIGQPAMYLSISLSPDGKYLLADKLVEPFSYLVGFSDFGHNLEVMDVSGKTLSTVLKTPLREGVRSGDDAGGDQPHDFAWRPDGRGLSFLWMEERARGAESDPEAAARKDRIMLLAPPFNLTESKTVLSDARRISDVTYAKDGKYVFATLAAAARAGARRSQDIVAYDLSAAQPQPYVLVKNLDPEDIVNAPGSVKTTSSGNGTVWAMMPANGDSVYLQSAGYKADFRPRPFIDKVTIRNAQKLRLFEGSRDAFERPLVALDDDMSRMIISRETKSSIPDSFLWSKGDAADNLTRNKDPYPDITAAKRVDFEFTRQDGVVIHGRISLPTNYKEGTRVPAVYWDYPKEYATGQEYERDAIRSRNYNAYTPLSFLRWSDLWLTQGYALVYIDIPIVGKNNSYNDFYVSNLVDSVYASIRKLDQMGYIDVDRLGHGGHSYGAFTTGNLLAHSTFFKAGIAGDGAYNRTLTPMTFQNEKRMFWDAPTTYMEMSPFFYADQINAPLLMYHAMEDDNSGTFPIQSFRMMQALTGLGKKAALYVYPFEAHSPRCKETYLDIWARWTDWFDTYVKKESRSSQ
jgi:dipeptidyl aminopeptidase/acylaminoacyl peptidase